MAVNATYSKAFTGIKRTAHIEIDAPYGLSPTIEANREILEIVDGEVAQRVIAPTVHRRLADCSPIETVTTSTGKSLTAAEIAEAVALMIDSWDSE